MLLIARMNTKKTDARMDHMAEKAKDMAGKASTLVAEVKGKAERAGDKVDEIATRNEHLVRDAAEKASDALDEIAASVAHTTGEVAHKVARGAEALANKVEHAGHPTGATPVESSPGSLRKNGG